jgi:hypothetical protein
MTENNFNRIRFIIYTNESNLSLAGVALNEFLLHAPKDVKVNVVSNKIPENKNLKNSDLYYSADIEQKNGKQFSSVLLKFLESIDEDYIFFNCDDYIVYKEIEKSDFNKLINFIDFHKVDYFSFDKKLFSDTISFEVFKNNFYENNLINIISKNHYYRFSVQPCVWKKSSLMDVLRNFVDINVQELETSEEIRKLDLLTLGVNWHNLGISIPANPGYDTHFCYSWAEVVRSGVFISTANGFTVNEMDFNCVINRKLIEDYNMQQTNDFNNVMYKMKNKN